MPKSVLLILCVAGGALLIGWALLAPAHFRSVDERVIERIGQGSPKLEDLALSQTNRAVAVLQSLAAERLQLPRHEAAVRHASRLPLGNHQVWGIPIASNQLAIATFMIQPGEKLRHARQTNTSFEASTVLRTAGMTNLTIFFRADTASGQPFEAAILVTASLLASQEAAPGLQSGIVQMMARGEASEIESFYLDVIALARRLNWDQLIFLTRRFESPRALAGFAEALRHFETDLPVLFSAASMADQSGAMAEYVLQFGAEGIRDIERAIPYGKAALDRLLDRGLPLWHSNWRDTLLEYDPFYPMYVPWLHLSLKAPMLTLGLKYLVIFLGGFLLALSHRFARERTGDDLGYVWFSENRFVRQALFGLLTVMLVLALGEPYLAQGEQLVEPAPKINLSAVLGAVAQPAQPSPPRLESSMFDQYTILALVLFLVLQGIIYAICLLKLSEIRRQPLASSLKLRLLDNEENLFDSGLYIGLFGTVASLIGLAMGILKPSLVAAYSSTLFGILFVAILKIGHVRPYKRRLLLEVDQHSA